MIKLVYTWLPRVFGCHCRSDRSFYFNGRQFPICARCTGELAGFLFSIILFFFWKPSISVSFVLIIPLIIDGFVQRLTSYESTNIRRFVTGFLFGVGLMALIVQTTIKAFIFGVNYGRTIGARLLGMVWDVLFLT